jgi:hypothetical protein
MSSLRRLVPPLLAALALVALAVAVSACGYVSHEKEVVEGEPVELGGIHYNVIFSRYLNPNDHEDSAYLVGQPPAPPETNYFGVFFEVQNESDQTKFLPKGFTIRDADNQPFEALASESLYAFPLSGEVEAEEQIPVLSTPPQSGPIEGSVVLFLLTDDASQNRPLTLEIESPNGEKGEVKLDL